MPRGSVIAVVALVSAVLGGAVSLLGAKATGLVEHGTSTVYVPAAAAEGPSLDELVAASARPLLGNGFEPARIYAARSPGVVTVFAFFEQADRHAAQGSSFVVSEEGYILTSAHVITNAGDGATTTEATRVFVGFKDRDRVKAEIVGWDAYDDVGLLRVAPGAIWA